MLTQQVAATIAVILIVAIVGVVAIRHLQRTFFYPPPAGMPDLVEEDISGALRRFEAALANHAPEVLAALQPGLTDAEIVAIEAEYRLRLTEELRALYRWRNGSLPDDRANLIPGHWFVPLDHAARIRQEMRRQVSDQPLVQRVAFFIFAGHRTGWLAVLDDLCGDGYFYDPGRRRRGGSFFYSFAENRQYRFFPSLSNFLVGAAECYETGIYKRDRRGRLSEDFEQSFALWERYASG